MRAFDRGWRIVAVATGWLGAGAFVRVHRSVLLRVAKIAAIEPLFHGEYLITLVGGATFTSARSHRAELRRALGLEPRPLTDPGGRRASTAGA